SQLSHLARRLSVLSVANADRRPIAMAQVDQKPTAIPPISSRTQPSTPQLEDHPCSPDVISSHRADTPLSIPAPTHSHLSHHDHPSPILFSGHIGVVGSVNGAEQQSPTQMPSQDNNSHSPPTYQQPESDSLSPPSTSELTLPLAPVRALN